MSNWQEWIGYLASALVAVSLLMSSVKKLRWINMAGAFVFTVYGALIDSWPVLLMNAFLVVVNIYYLVKLNNKSLKLHLKREDWQNPLTKKFMCRFNSEIIKLFPEFDYKHNKSDLHLIYNNFEIAGFLAGNLVEDKIQVDVLFIQSKYKGYNFEEKLFETNKLVQKAYSADEYGFNLVAEPTKNYLKQFKINL
ncbi:YgjV family protein [Saccharicrinis sp. FJH54]|uniref:YgjV family protein n=1 Tax=Saccharicrinis sp. FJH54 TaxID=3344665 RepID=UPI0035D4462B